ncbi:MAG: chemotaxis protein CheA, partial [Pseudomonadota bacterium]
DAMSFADMLSDVQGDPAPQEADSQPEIQPETQSENTREPAPPQAAASQGDPKPEPKAEKADKTAAKASATPAIQSVRVDLDKVDRVVNMVGELVITQAMLTEQIDDRLRDNYTDLVRGLEVLAQHSRSLQDSVMAIRAQPVKSVFARMPRLIRELSAQTGKKIRLEMHGETTEIDKTVIEQLSDPLTHMIRNSADHGIESPEARAEQGKPEEGTIMLSAEQAGGKIVIRVSDDGAGINRKRVYGLAVERGIIAEDAVLSDEDIDQLVFAPGFSTAESVSNISGRGVGMDVVRQNIQKLGGRVHVKSEPGRGSSVTLTLPLTLAVLDVMMVRVGEASYVLPLGSIVESIQMSDASVNTLPDGARVLQLRGEYIQVIDLASLFSFTSSVPESDQFLILCELEGNAKIGLVVDTILGQQQVVIKSLEENFARLDGIAGATILGDGRVALILDVTSLKSLHRARSGAEAA